MSGILVLAETRRGELRDVSLELVSAAAEVKEPAGGRLTVAVIGADAEQFAGDLAAGVTPLGDVEWALRKLRFAACRARETDDQEDDRRDDGSVRPAHQ